MRSNKLDGSISRISSQTLLFDVKKNVMYFDMACYGKSVVVYDAKESVVALVKYITPIPFVA